MSSPSFSQTQFQSSAIDSVEPGNVIGAFDVLTKFFREERAHAEQYRHEVELKLEQERHENARLREQATTASAAAESTALKSELAVAKSELAVALQSRIEKLHVMQLLEDDELYALEDIIADGADDVDDEDRVAQMVALSARMHGDGAFARQMRRKFLR